LLARRIGYGLALGCVAALASPNLCARATALEHLAKQPAAGLDAARLCLGDERLVAAWRHSGSARGKPARPMPSWITLAV
jgi:hypothetical protein